MMIRAYLPLFRLALTPVVISAQQAPAAVPERTAIATDPYHPQPLDTLEATAYNGWKRYSLFCDRCHGQDALGTSFGPNLVTSMAADGAVPSKEAFLSVLAAGRPERGMPAAASLGLEPEYFEDVYAYLRGRSSGQLHGGRPALRNP